MQVPLLILLLVLASACSATAPNGVALGAPPQGHATEREPALVQPLPAQLPEPAQAQEALPAPAETASLGPLDEAETREEKPAPVYVFSFVTGKEETHTVAAGETIGSIAKKYKVNPKTLAAMNGIPANRSLRPGQAVRVSNRRVFPLTTQDGVVVDLLRLRLYWMREGEVVDSFPVAAGRKSWETPPGDYTITGRRRDPVWHVPPSIQREMKERGQEVKTKVPAGPQNPLGKYWLQLSASGIGIHGTNAPWSVGKFATHGCIRMHAKDIERLFKEVPTGTVVKITDDPVRIARTEDGRVWVEAQANRKGASMDTIQQRLAEAGLAEAVDGEKLHQAVRNAWGIAVEVTREPAPEAQARN